MYRIHNKLFDIVFFHWPPQTSHYSHLQFYFIFLYFFTNTSYFINVLKISPYTSFTIFLNFLFLLQLIPMTVGDLM